jgi:hypothetical protein
MRPLFEGKAPLLRRALTAAFGEFQGATASTGQSIADLSTGTGVTQMESVPDQIVNSIGELFEKLRGLHDHGV